MDWSLLFGGLFVWAWTAAMAVGLGYVLLASGFHAWRTSRRRLREGRRRAAFWFALYAVAFGGAWQLVGGWLLYETAGRLNEEELFLLACAGTLALPMPLGAWALIRLWRGDGGPSESGPDAAGD